MKWMYVVVLSSVLTFMNLLPAMSAHTRHSPDRQGRPVILRLDPSVTSSYADPKSSDHDEYQKLRFHVYGRNFLRQSVICADGVPVKTEYVSGKHLIASASEMSAHGHVKEPHSVYSWQVYVNVTIRNPGKKPRISRAKVYRHDVQGGGG